MGGLWDHAVSCNLAYLKYSLVQLGQRDSLPHSFLSSRSTITTSLSMSWHHHICGDVSLRWCDGVPTCDTCGGSASSIITDTIETPHPPPAPENQKRSQLKLSWPPCVEYSGPIIDEKGSNVTAFLIENIDRWENASLGCFGTENDGELAKRPAREGPHGGNKTNESPVGVGIDDALSKIDDPARTSQTNRPKHALENIYGHLLKPYGLRLLRLHGSESLYAPVHCSIEVTALDDPKASTYEALSYTWADLDGDKRNCMPVFIGPRYQVLLVTRNCHSALRSLRTRHDRVVWVDAICINQHDPLERQFQVGLMPEIYTSAARVLVYLGEGRNSSEKAMRLVAAHPTSDEDGREALTQLLRRPYFHRIWVIQEVAHARKASVTCGNETIHWTSLCSAFQSCKLDLNWINHFSVPILASQNPPELLQLLINTRNSDCADPRDRVYGLVGLVHPDEAKLFPVDYSLPVQHIYTGLAAYWARQPQGSLSFDFLSFAQTEKKISGLPSWVPDWSNLADRQSSTVGLRVGIDITGISIPQSSWGFDATDILFPSSHWNAADSEREPGQSCGFIIAEHDGFYVRRHTETQADSAKIHEINGPIIQSDVGSLVIEGYPLFRYSQGELTFAGGHNAGLLVKNSKFDGHPRVLDSEQELEIFYFPRWSKALLVKRHVDSIFSVEGSLFINLFSSDRGRRTNSSFSKLDEACDHIGQHEASLVLSWFVTVNFLRKCPPHGSEYFDPSTEPFSMIKSAVKRRSLAKTNESSIRNDHLELMKQMRTEMLQSLTTKDVDMFLQTAKSERWKLWESQVPLHLDVRRQFEEQFCELLPKWTRLEGQPEDLIMSWRQDVTRLKPLVARGCYAEILQGLCHKNYPGWRIRGQFPFRSNWRKDHTGIDEARVLSVAFTYLREASLSDSESWERNRDQFWICLMSFDLIARLGEFLYHRQVLFLLRESISDRETEQVTLI